MDVERAVLPLQLHAPHAIHQRCACEDDALIFQQQAQQFEFLVRQCDVRVVHLHDALRRTDTQRPGAVFARRGGACPPEHGPDARRKLQHTERLRDEIIRTAVESDDAVIFRVPCGQQDDGQRPRGGGGAQIAQNVQSVLLREHEVEQHQLRQGALHRAVERGWQREALHCEALALQSVDDELADGLVVLKNIDHGCFLPFHLSSI